MILWLIWGIGALVCIPLFNRAGYYIGWNEPSRYTNNRPTKRSWWVQVVIFALIWPITLAAFLLTFVLVVIGDWIGGGPRIGG